MIKDGIALSFHQAKELAHKLLGKDADDLFAKLRKGEPIPLRIQHVDRSWHEHTVTWNPSGQTGPTNFYINYPPLWHLEFRRGSGYWHVEKAEVRDYFVWMTLALLSMPNPYSIPGVPEQRCISIWPYPGMFGAKAHIA